MLGGLVLLVLAATIAAHALRFLYQQSTSPLRDIPGPFWTRFTRAWYFLLVRQGHFHRKNIHIHEKFGPVVRIAPGWYSCSGAEATKKIYALGSKFTKSDWYDGWSYLDPKQWSLFSDKNERRHAETRRVFGSLYSVSSLMSYEPFVDRCVDLFIDRLAELSQTNQEIDLSHWMSCYSFDVIGCITLGKRFGFLDSGEDINGVMRAIHSIAPFSTLSGIYHEWYRFSYKINSYVSRSGASGRKYLAEFALKNIAKLRQQDNEQTAEKIAQIQEKGMGGNVVSNSASREPFVTKMIRYQRQSPDKVSDYHLTMLARSNIGAGFDTTAISLCSVVYHLIKSPLVLQKLRNELDTVRKTGKISDRITFQESQSLPYFQAVMKEALRMHPATGLPLWRVVPEGGVEIDGVCFPGGTVLGVNSWVSHYDKDVFTNPTVFCPERWIDQDEAKLKAMNDLYMPVGLTFQEGERRHLVQGHDTDDKPIKSVWARYASMHRTTHLDTGDVKVDPCACR